MANFVRDIVQAVMDHSEAKVKKEVYEAIFSSVVSNSDDPAYIFESDKIWRIEHGGGLNRALSAIISEDFMTESIKNDIDGYLKYKNADFDMFQKEMEKITEESGLCEKEKEKIKNAGDGPLMAAMLLGHCGKKEKDEKEREKKKGRVSLMFEEGGCVLTLCAGTALSLGKNEDGEFVVKINE